MPKYLIRWNVGCGDNYDVVDADTQDKAENIAYDEWSNLAETEADYGAVLATPQAVDEAGLCPSDYGIEEAE